MKRLFHIAWMCLAVAACSKDELPGTHGEFASLTLSVASSQNDVTAPCRPMPTNSGSTTSTSSYSTRTGRSVPQLYLQPERIELDRNHRRPDVRHGEAWRPPLPIRTIRSSTYPRDARRHRLACGVGFVRGEPPGQVHRTGHQLPDDGRRRECHRHGRQSRLGYRAADTRRLQNPLPRHRGFGRHLHFRRLARRVGSTARRG